MERQPPRPACWNVGAGLERQALHTVSRCLLCSLRDAWPSLMRNAVLMKGIEPGMDTGENRPREGGAGVLKLSPKVTGCLQLSEGTLPAHHDEARGHGGAFEFIPLEE